MGDHSRSGANRTLGRYGSTHLLDNPLTRLTRKCKCLPDPNAAVLEQAIEHRFRRFLPLLRVRDAKEHSEVLSEHCELFPAPLRLRKLRPPGARRSVCSATRSLLKRVKALCSSTRSLTCTTSPCATSRLSSQQVEKSFHSTTRFMISLAGAALHRLLHSQASGAAVQSLAS